MELDSVAKIVAAFYRLVGTESADDALVDHGESVDDIAYQYLTRGSRSAQRFMLDAGYGGWRTRSSAITWSGTDATTGGKYSALPSDFLRAVSREMTGAGSPTMSALREANGDGWGRQIDAGDDQLKGDYYYFRGEQLWLARNASPPTTAYLDYHYLHPEWSSGVTIDFPLAARSLIVAEAANVAKEENWLPGGIEMEGKIERALVRAQKEALEVARQTRGPRRLRKPPRYGNRWVLLLGFASAAATVPVSLADAAVPPPVDVARPLGVVGMPAWAMSLPGIDGGEALSAHHVLGSRDGLHMARIDAAPDAAKMVDVHARRDGADELLIDEAVDIPVGLLLGGGIVGHLAHRVAVVVTPSGPFPTPRLGVDADPGPEPCRQLVGFHSDPLPPGEQADGQFEDGCLGQPELLRQHGDESHAGGSESVARSDLVSHR